MLPDRCAVQMTYTQDVNAHVLASVYPHKFYGKKQVVPDSAVARQGY